MDYEYIFRKMCERRGVALSKVESVAFNVLVNFSLATNTYLLPVVADTFYWVDRLNITTNSLTGVPAFILEANSGQGSAGNVVAYVRANVEYSYFALELNSLQYVVATHSAGQVYLTGGVYKITTA